MKAVILVGGQGTRLRPLTINTPKAMVPVLNTPFLEHVICHLSRHNVREITLALSHLAQPITDYFGDGSRFGVRLNYVLEKVPLGTAGAVKNTEGAESFLDEPFLVLNGDIVTDLDITAMLDFHRQKGAKITIALTPVDDPTSYGLIETDAYGRVTQFLEKPSWSQVTTNMINAGTYILEPDVMAYIPPRTKFSFEHELFPLFLRKDKPIYAYPSAAYWIDIGTPEKYLHLNIDLLSGKSSQYGHGSGGKVVIGGKCDIHPTAEITAPAVIGDNCTIGQRVRLRGPVVIGSGCRIQDDAVITESVIWQDVNIGSRVRLKGSVIASNCRLEDGCIAEEVVLGDNVTVASGYKLEAGSKIWPGTAVG